MERRIRGNALAWLLLFAGAVFVFVMLLILPFGEYQPFVDEPDSLPDIAQAELKTFASCDALAETLVRAGERTGGYAGRGIAIDSAMPQALGDSSAGFGGGAGVEYTGTNVQVAGVDEADVVKTDGDYVYVLTQGDVFIVDVRNPGAAAIVGSIESGGRWASDIFVSGNVLAVFTTDFIEAEPVPFPSTPDGGEGVSGSPGVAESSDALLYPYPGYQTQLVSVELYNIADRANPVRLRTLQFEGNLLTSRLIDDEIIVVVQSWPNYQLLATDATTDLVPQFRDGADADLAPVVDCGSVDYIDPIVENNYLTVARFSVADPAGAVERSVTLGAGSTVYVSHDALYVAGGDYWYGGIVPVPLGAPVTDDSFPVQQEPREQTRVHAFSLGDAISYRGSTRVPGSVLNQFSMDEHQGAFRIATTEHRWDGGGSGPVNALYLLDAASLERLGAIENIAPGETIYAARFLGERAYLVTFKQVDPFFVIDVADPRNPRILGQLKIPGYSDYLHPFNAEGTMVIGVGKNATIADGDFAWYQGMKIALFDATDPTNPVQLHSVDIGDRGTDSPALQNHKAFLFDPSRNLLVLPVLLAELSGEVKEQEIVRGEPYGDFTYQGAYAYQLTAEDGFTQLGRLTHLDDPDAFFAGSGFYSGSSIFFVNRALRIGDNLVTLSDGKLVLSNITEGLTEVTQVRFPVQDDEPPIVFEEEIFR